MIYIRCEQYNDYVYLYYCEIVHAYRPTFVDADKHLVHKVDNTFTSYCLAD